MEKQTVKDVLEVGKENCCGCYGCKNICPVEAIEMVSDNYGFWYPEINSNKCINCGLCYKVCPTANVEPGEKRISHKYAMYNKNEEERINSSSGGIFILIAKKILDEDGVVFGAGFDEDYNIVHKFIKKEEDLYELMKSKYVQSKIGDSYKNAKELLDAGKNVLFTGTPCQIEGLYRFLQKDYKNLFTQDFVCHGVPSPKSWKIFLNEILKKYKMKKSDNLEISFRNKDKGWKKFNLKIVDKNKNIVYCNDLIKDPYLKMFLQNVSLRDSCFNCKFKKEYRMSDITLSDYWGAQKLEPKLDDDKGLSLISINSEKGKELISEIEENIIYKSTNFEKALSWNTCWTKSVPVNNKRHGFFGEIEEKNFEELSKKYETKENIFKKIKRYLLKIKSKILN